MTCNAIPSSPICIVPPTGHDVAPPVTTNWADLVVSAIFRATILQGAVPDSLRGRLSAIHIVVVTGGWVVVGAGHAGRSCGGEARCSSTKASQASWIFRRSPARAAPHLESGCCEWHDVSGRS